MRPKNYFSSSLFIVILLCFSARDLAAQSVNQEIEDTPLLLSQEPRTPELSPVEIEPIEAPGITIAEDDHGFMWFGGTDGIYRFDGHDYVHYQHDPDDSTSLSEAWVHSLYTDSDGVVWVGTLGGGLNRFDTQTETFTHFKKEKGNPLSLSQDTVTVILEDSQGALWIGTHGGLNRFDKSSQTFERFLHDPENPNSLSNNQVRALYEDSQGTLWIGTGSPVISETPIGIGGLNRFHPESETFTRYLHEPDDSTSLINNKVMSMYEDSRGTFWIGTLGDGLHSMNRQTGTFTRHQFDLNDTTKISRPFLNGSTQIPEDCVGFECGGVSFIHEDRQGILLIGGVGGGVNRYDPETGAMSHHEESNSGLSANTIWTIHESQDGTLWVGTASGSHKLYASANSFPLITPESGFSDVAYMREDSDHHIWIQVWNRLGLQRLDRRTGNIYQYDPQENDPKSLLEKQVNETAIGPEGNLWVAYGNGGISRYIDLENRFEHYFTDSVSTNKLLNSVTILIDKEGLIWVGAWGSGLYHLDPQTQTFLNHYTHDPDNSNSLSDNRVGVLYENRDGDIWIGTADGINLIERKKSSQASKNFIQRFLSGTDISSIQEDNEGHLWVATTEDGFFELDPSTGQSIQYTTSDGLPSNHIQGLLVDNDGFIWMSSYEDQYGSDDQVYISRFNPRTSAFTNYGKQNGLPDIDFSVNNAVKTHDGLLLFGGNGGFTFFNPSLIKDPTYSPPKIAMTGLQISNEQIVPAPDGILTRPVHLEKLIELSHEQNDITLDYAAFAFSNEDQIRYEYQLEPYDADWVNARSQRSARYSQLPPGEYQFRVRTLDSRGVYSVNEATLGITILPPWWRTWLAYGIYAFLFIVGFVAVDRIQRRRLISKEREKARERELKQEKKYSKQLQEAYSELEDSLKKLTAAQDQLVQQEKLASLGQLTAGIAHEIKNPLNFVNNFSDLSIEIVEETRQELLAIKPKPKDALLALDDIEMNLKKIHEHGTRADDIVKSMLQHSRGSDGKMEPTDLNALIKEYTNLAFHGMRAGKDPIDVDMKLDLDDDVGEVDLFAEDFSRVILNLCNNGFDAMKEKLSQQDSNISDQPPFDGSGDTYTPRLIIRSKRENRVVTLEIEDNGPGIPKEIRDKILQPFFTTKKGTAGTGLGLSITHDIVKAHGGQLDVESENGQYTRFRIELK